MSNLPTNRLVLPYANVPYPVELKPMDEMRAGYLHLWFPEWREPRVIDLINESLTGLGWLAEEASEDPGTARYRHPRTPASLAVTPVCYLPTVVTVGRLDDAGDRFTRSTLTDLLSRATAAGGGPLTDACLVNIHRSAEYAWRDVTDICNARIPLLYWRRYRRCPRCPELNEAADPVCWSCDYQFTGLDDQTRDAAMAAAAKQISTLDRRLVELAAVSRASPPNGYVTRTGLVDNFDDLDLPAVEVPHEVPAGHTVPAADDLPAKLWRAGERWGWRYHRQGTLIPPPESLPYQPFPDPAFAAGQTNRLSRREAWAQWRNWMTACRAAVVEHRRQQRERMEGQIQHIEAMLRRQRALRWSPLRPASGRVDVYGGTTIGWSCLLTTLVGSLHGSDTRTVVLDFSSERVSKPLLAEAERWGVSTRRRGHDPLSTPWLPFRAWRIPDEGPELDLFTGLGPGDVADSLAEALHAADGARDAARDAARDIHRHVLADVCDILAPALTMPRIYAALRVLAYEEARRGADSPLTAGEFDRLGDVFGARLATQQQELRTLLSALRPLSGWGAENASPLVTADARLAVIELDPGVLGTDATRLAALCVQVLARQLNGRADWTVYTRRTTRESDPPPRAELAVIVAGADLLPGSHLEWMDRIARTRNARVIYLFRHLDGETRRQLGRSGSVVLMRLGNADEAEAASRFIGREQRFVMHQATRGTSSGSTESTTFSHSHTSQQSTALPNYGWLVTSTSGYNTSLSMGQTAGTNQSTNTSTSVQRVIEPLVEPLNLQRLPDTAFLLIDPQDRTGPRARLGDCNPFLIDEPGAAPAP